MKSTNKVRRISNPTASIGDSVWKLTVELPDRYFLEIVDIHYFESEREGFVTLGI